MRCFLLPLSAHVLHSASSLTCNHKVNNRVLEQMTGHRLGIGTLIERLSVIGTTARRAAYGARCDISVSSSRSECAIGLPPEIGAGQQRRQIAQAGKLEIGAAMTIPASCAASVKSGGSAAVLITSMRAARSIRLN